MIESVRTRYNKSFTEERYRSFLAELDELAGYHLEFRVAETPLFIPLSFQQKLIAASEEILQTIYRPDYKSLTNRAIPPDFNVPNEGDHPDCIAIDFAVCKTENGELVPKLIEMQGFASLYAYEHALALLYPKYFAVPPNFSHLLNYLSNETYVELLKKWIIGKHHPENVVLLEVEPEKQKTRVDFELTKKFTGINYICISKVIREGRKLFYEKDGKNIPIYRIYNRVIFDEFSRRKDLHCQFHLSEEVDVEWVSHPNWFFRISKFTIPFLKSSAVPFTQLVSELRTLPDDLENYVLKPLYSFSGSGVLFDVKKEDIEKLNNPAHFILQRKVNYEPVLKSPTGSVKCEIRMMFIWLKEWEKPQLVINLVRLSKGKMIGVDYNKNLDWVGGSVGLFEQ